MSLRQVKNMKKKVLSIGVFNPVNIYQASPYPGDNVFAKGFEQNDFDVERFDYRSTPYPNEELLKIAEKDNYDIFWFGKCEKINPETIGILKLQNKDSIFCKWAADVRNEPTWHDLGHNQYIDYFFGTFGGEYLKKHLLPNMKGVCSIFAFTDSDFYKPIKNKEYSSDILWTGRKGFGDNPLRNEIIDNLLKNENNFNIKMYGIENTEWLQDPEYLYAISNTKIGIGSNSFDRYLYSSDRIGNYMACGTFYLTQYIEGIEKVFKKGYHLDWFSNVEEMNVLIKYYLKNEEERKQIAKRGQEFILENFDCGSLVKNCLNVIKTYKSLYQWDDVFVNN